MATVAKLTTDETRMVEAKLRARFPDSTAYRYNSVSIRVRVVDEAFEGRSLVEREKLVEPLIEELPEATQTQIVFLLLLSPREAGAERAGQLSLMKAEFEAPIPSHL